MRIADLRLHKTELGKVEGGSYYWILVLLKWPVCVSHLSIWNREPARRVGVRRTNL